MNNLVNALNFEVAGIRPVSKKNLYGISRNGGLYQKKQAAPFITAVQDEASVLRYALAIPMIPDDMPFTLEYTIHVKSYGTVDLDGVGTTLLDALQGIIYPDDKMCIGIVGRKVVNKKADYRVEICVKWEGEI